MLIKFFHPSFLLGCLLLAACAEPTAMMPGVSAQELARERAEQEAYAQGKNPNGKNYSKISFSTAELNQMDQRLTAVTKRIAPEATLLCRELNGPEANCDMVIDLAKGEKGINAHADGTKLVIYPAMVDFAEKDVYLAMVLAHEYTHHFMQHVQSSQKNVMTGALIGTLADMLASSQGVNTGGQLGQFGAQKALLSYSPSFEHEADYISMYIIARAGYPIEEAPYFWREMSRNNPQGIYNRTTHPTTPERFVALEKTIAEINLKKQQGQRLLPNIRVQ